MVWEMTNDDLELISQKFKIEKEKGPLFFLSAFILHILHISWRGSHTQIQTVPSTLLGDGGFLLASLRHLVTLIDRLTQTMCIWRVSSTEGMLGKHKCHLSPKRESGDSHRESNFKREMDKKKIDEHFLSQGPSGGWLHESEFQIHYFSKYVPIGLPQLHCHMYLFLQDWCPPSIPSPLGTVRSL